MTTTFARTVAEKLKSGRFLNARRVIDFSAEATWNPLLAVRRSAQAADSTSKSLLNPSLFSVL